MADEAQKAIDLRKRDAVMVGAYSIIDWGNDQIYIMHASGEGMQTTKKKLEAAIEEFYQEEF